MKQEIIWRWLKHWSLKCYQTPPVAHQVFLFPFIPNATYMSRSSPIVQPGFLSYRAGKMLSGRKWAPGSTWTRLTELFSLTLSFRNNTLSQFFQELKDVLFPLFASSPSSLVTFPSVFLQVWQSRIGIGDLWTYLNRLTGKFSFCPTFIHKKLIVFWRFSIRWSRIEAGNGRTRKQHPRKRTETHARGEQPSSSTLYTDRAGQDNKTQVGQTWTGQNNQTWKGRNKGRKRGTVGEEQICNRTQETTRMKDK